MNERVISIFAEMVGLLREARERGEICPSDLGNFDQVVKKNIHARLLGLVALASFRQGFRVEIEAKWPLTIGNRKMKYRPDLTLRDSQTIVVEVDTIDMVACIGMRDDRYAPKYVKENMGLFEGRLRKSVLLRLLSEQHDKEIDALMHIITLPKFIKKTPPWKTWRYVKMTFGLEKAYDCLMHKYLEEAKEFTKPLYLTVISEGWVKLYRKDRRLKVETW